MRKPKNAKKPAKSRMLKAARMNEEELPLEVEDRHVVRRLERGQDAVLRPHGDLRAEAEDLVRLVEGDHERRDLGNREQRPRQEPEAEELTPLDTADEARE